MAKPDFYLRIDQKRVSFSAAEIEAARQLLHLGEEDHHSSCSEPDRKSKRRDCDAFGVSSSNSAEKNIGIGAVCDGDDGDSDDEPLRRRRRRFRSIGEIYEIATRA